MVCCKIECFLSVPERLDRLISITLTKDVVSDVDQIKRK